MDFSNEKHEYLLHTWGGFYNDEHHKIHGRKPGFFWFDSMEKLQDHLADLKAIEAEQKATHLMSTVTEGQHVRYKTIAKIKFVYKGKEYDYQEEFGYAYPPEDAIYMFTEGNYACDCNRSLMLARKYGEEILLQNCGQKIIMKDLEILQVKK